MRAVMLNYECNLPGLITLLLVKKPQSSQKAYENSDSTVMIIIVH